MQNRLDRLQSSGAILGFTIRAHKEVEKGKVRAVMMIEVVGKSTSQVIEQLRGITAIEQLHTTNGQWDLVAEVTTTSLEEFDLVLREVREINGVISSETSILLSTI